MDIYKYFSDPDKLPFVLFFALVGVIGVSVIIAFLGQKKGMTIMLIPSMFFTPGVLGLIYLTMRDRMGNAPGLLFVIWGLIVCAIFNYILYQGYEAIKAGKSAKVIPFKGIIIACGLLAICFWAFIIEYEFGYNTVPKIDIRKRVVLGTTLQGAGRTGEIRDQPKKGVERP